ncbi:MAG: DUF2442 domain-containing protein [Acidobacteriaceae bacterium]
MVTQIEVERTAKRAKRFAERAPKAVSARYDRRLNRVIVRLNSNLDIAFSPKDAEGLERATPSQLQAIEITPSGFGIHFPKLDADLYLPALLEGFLGSRKWMARRLGMAGGKSRSAAKKLAARNNGKLGGRPRKVAAG